MAVSGYSRHLLSKCVFKAFHTTDVSPPPPLPVVYYEIENEIQILFFMVFGFLLFKIKKK